MTARATPPAALPTIATGPIRPWLDALVRLGYDRGRLLAAAGLAPDGLEDPDGRVPCTVPERMVAQAQRERPRANLSLDLASVTPLGAHPLVDYLAVSSGTVGEGLEQVARFYRLLGAPGSMELRDRDDPIEVRFGAMVAFAMEYSVAICLIHLARESDGRARARVVRFAHSPGDPRAFERMLGCPVEVGATWSGFEMSRETWRLPMRRRDPILLSLLERHAEDVLARLPRTDDVVEQVRRALAQGLTAGEATMTAVARALALAPRTLQRRLAAAGTTFQRVVEETRREAAVRHLEQSELSIAEIAFVLGYSEPAAFHRAFRRWQGATPRDFRVRARAGASG